MKFRTDIPEGAGQREEYIKNHLENNSISRAGRRNSAERYPYGELNERFTRNIGSHMMAVKEAIERNTARP